METLIPPGGANPAPHAPWAMLCEPRSVICLWLCEVISHIKMEETRPGKKNGIYMLINYHSKWRRIFLQYIKSVENVWLNISLNNGLLTINLHFFSIAKRQWAQLESRVQNSNYSLHYQQSPELNSSHHLQNSFQATQLLTHGSKHAQCSQTLCTTLTEITHTVTQNTLRVKTLASNTNTENTNFSSLQFEQFQWLHTK